MKPPWCALALSLVVATASCPVRAQATPSGVVTGLARGLEGSFEGFFGRGAPRPREIYEVRHHGVAVGEAVVMSVRGTTATLCLKGTAHGSVTRGDVLAFVRRPADPASAGSPRGDQLTAADFEELKQRNAEYNKKTASEDAARPSHDPLSVPLKDIDTSWGSHGLKAINQSFTLGQITGKRGNIVAEGHPTTSTQVASTPATASQEEAAPKPGALAERLGLRITRWEEYLSSDGQVMLDVTLVNQGSKAVAAVTLACDFEDPSLEDGVGEDVKLAQLAAHESRTLTLDMFGTELDAGTKVGAVYSATVRPSKYHARSRTVVLKPRFTILVDGH